LILVYHRVATVDRDPWGLCVSEDNFVAQLEVINERANPIPLQKLISAKRDTELPQRPVSLTFDDGYLDNLKAAKPLLEHFQTPATMFLTTGYFAAAHEYWWDALERIVFGHALPNGNLTLEINKQTHTWTVDTSSCATLPGDTWRAWEEPRNSRDALYQSLYKILSPLTLNEKHAVLKQLESWSGAEPLIREGYRSVTVSEARELAASPQIEVGAHTVTHPVLSSQSVAVQKSEIQESAHTLERLIEKPVTSFAYPYGKRSHYTRKTVSLLRESGFRCGCANFWGVVTTRTNRYELPRIQALNCGADEFSREMDLWFQG
jgi:peptidoglycan/xylan/chitin deacetylase (PgdA/CDA1 family)